MNTSNSPNPNGNGWLLYKKPPALIPNVPNTAGNRRLTIEFWNHLWVAHKHGRDIEKIAMNFLKLHPSKSDVIRSIGTHYAHCTGLNYEMFSQEWYEFHLAMVDQYPKYKGTIRNTLITIL